MNIEKTKTLAMISKRIEELKDKIEAGQLRVDDLADLAIEYKILKKAHKELLYSSDMLGSLERKGDSGASS